MCFTMHGNLWLKKKIHLLLNFILNSGTLLYYILNLYYSIMIVMKT